MAIGALPCALLAGGNAAGTPLPNPSVMGLERTTGCIFTHQNQCSQHSVTACRRRTEENAPKHPTLLLYSSRRVVGDGSPWSFPHSPHLEKGLKAAGFVPAEALSTG